MSSSQESRDDRPPGKEEMPGPVYELESVAHQVCWYWQKESMFPGENALDERDDRTVSVVVRDADGEVIGESRLWEFAGTYALVRFQNGDVETLEEKEPAPDLPSWAEWVHADAPLDHHVVGVRCTECDQEYERYDGSMPGRAARTEPWDQIDHRPDCSHASDLDRKKWWGRQYAIEVRARPDPRVMALDCLWDELAELRAERGRMYADEAVRSRHVAIFSVLEDRMQTNYPGCSECSGEIRRVDEWGLECSDCHETIRDEVYQEWWDQHRRLWGLRGQGGRGWSPKEVDDGR